MLPLFLALTAIALTASSAKASSITIDSTNCNSSGGCFGMDWTLTVNSGSFQVGSDTFGFQAILGVTDDPLVSGTPTAVISAVDFKVSDSVDSGVVLDSFPTSSSDWTTAVNVLSSSGCADNNKPGFVCSDTATDPANFTASSTAQTWIWYFNTSDPIFTNLVGAHIGAKLTDLSTPGHLLSATFPVPEPDTLVLLFGGLAALVTVGELRRRRLV